MTRGLDLLVNALDCESRGIPGSEKLVQEVCGTILPNGSGFDVTPTVEHFNLDGRFGHTKRIVIRGEFHDMNEVGMYKGWVPFSVTVKPSFFPEYFNVRVTLYGVSPVESRDLNEYIGECYYNRLADDYDEQEV